VDFLAIGIDTLSPLGFGYSRDDTEVSFLPSYKDLGIFVEWPFKQLDVSGIGKLIELAGTAARKTKPGIPIGFDC
jgi:pyruvate,orthophosphate dikinase